MNRGEGLKIAARAKHGIGLFQEEKKTKKKFSYKSRTQGFPVRKTQTNVDSKDLGKHSGPRSETRKTTSQGTQQKTDKNSASKETSRDNKHEMRSRNSGKNTGGRKRPMVDFIKKNKSVGGTNPAAAGGTSSGVGGADTIALTQEQLNAILQSIGAVSGETPLIAIENGRVKVTKKEDRAEILADERKDEMEENGADEREHRNDNSPMAPSENVLQLLQALEVDSDKAEIQSASSVPQRKKDGSGHNRATHFSSSNNSLKKGRSEEKKEECIWGNPVGMGNIGAVVDSQEGLSIQEKKRLEWKKALDKQIAEKKIQKEQETVLRRSLDTAETGVFHHRATGPPEVIDTHRNVRKDPVEDVVQESSLGHLTKQSNVPSAMRSNFLIGGSAGDDHIKELKRKEQLEWKQALEKQMLEAAEIKEQEKRKRQLEDSEIEHWTDKTSPRKDNNLQSQAVDHSSRVAPLAFKPLHTPDIISPRQSAEIPFSRGGFSSLVDPAEQERREMARRKHAEHMQAVQQQVEEKQRLKREAEERRKREEALQEKRLAAERENLQKQFDLEKEKQRQKEEAAAAKQRALEESIRNAQEEALAAKHAKRVQRLNQQGHDTSHLRKSWDAQHHIEASPRQVVHSSQQHQPVQHSPPPFLNGDTLTSESISVSTSSGGMKDAGTSTISDQSTQTGFGIESLSPAILEIIRQASAGIEYKGGNHDQRDNDSGQNCHRGKKSGHAKSEGTPGERDLKGISAEGRAKPPKQKKNTEKPKWGQNTGKKKVSNSDKDLSRVGKGREERRRKRQEELLAQQERLTRRRDHSSKQRPSSGVESHVVQEGATSGKGAKADREPFSRQLSKPDKERHREQSNERDSLSRGYQRGHSRTEGDHINGDAGYRGVNVRPESGTVEGNFYPFLRSEDMKLTKRSVTVTPDGERPVDQQEMYIDTNSYTPQPLQVQMDPLLNPDRLKDSGQRQERILEQLSHLRQGLMMKQREIELGLSPPMM